MARTVERNDGVTTERVVETNDQPAATTTYVERGGNGLGGVLAVIAVIAALAIAAFFFLNMSRQETLRTDAVSDAAGSVASSASRAADSIGSAAGDAAGAVNPAR